MGGRRQTEINKEAMWHSDKNIIQRKHRKDRKNTIVSRCVELG